MSEYEQLGPPERNGRGGAWIESSVPGSFEFGRELCAGIP